MIAGHDEQSLLVGAAGRRGDRPRRPRHVAQGLPGPARPAPDDGAADDRRRGRCRRHRAVAGGGRRHLAVRRRRADRGAQPGAGARRHPLARRARPGDGAGPHRRRRQERADGGASPIGAIIVVRPGERVALDGVVVAGSTSIDQAPITGESIPVAKEPGDPVFAGTINQRGTIDVRVTAARGDGTLDRIARSIQAARPSGRRRSASSTASPPSTRRSSSSPPSPRRRVPVLLGLGSFDEWLYRALVLLVLACPCALVISTPVTVVAGLGGAARRGILIKGGAAPRAGPPHAGRRPRQDRHAHPRPARS